MVEADHTPPLRPVVADGRQKLLYWTSVTLIPEDVANIVTRAVACDSLPVSVSLLTSARIEWGFLNLGTLMLSPSWGSRPPLSISASSQSFIAAFFFWALFYRGSPPSALSAGLTSEFDDASGCSSLMVAHLGAQGCDLDTVVTSLSIVGEGIGVPPFFQGRFSSHCWWHCLAPCRFSPHLPRKPLTLFLLRQPSNLCPFI